MTNEKMKLTRLEETKPVVNPEGRNVMLLREATLSMGTKRGASYF